MPHIPRVRRGVRMLRVRGEVLEAAEGLQREFGIEEQIGQDVVTVALDDGLGVEATARLLYGSIGGRLTLDRCRLAAARLPLRPLRQ